MRGDCRANRAAAGRRGCAADAARVGRSLSRPDRAQPRPTKGILVAMTVMNSTLASSGRLAMWTTASATWRDVHRRLDGDQLPSACSTPLAMRAVISVAALPMSIWPQAMS